MTPGIFRNSTKISQYPKTKTAQAGLTLILIFYSQGDSIPFLEQIVKAECEWTLNVGE